MVTVYELGSFRLDTQGDLLFRGSDPLALGRRAIALLRVLVERPGAVVSKDELIEAAWPGQAVEESNLTVQISALRRVLSEAPGGDRWIETMPRRGYRFVGPVVTEVQKGVTEVPSRADTASDLAPTPRSAQSGCFPRLPGRTRRPRSACPSKPIRGAVQPMLATRRSLASRALPAPFRGLADRPAYPGETVPTRGSPWPDFNQFRKIFGIFLAQLFAAFSDQIQDSRVSGAQAASASSS